MVCSMNRSGNLKDHATIESFFFALEIERVACKAFRVSE